MASTNKTTNYNLSQYIGSDKPTYLEDYNSDMRTIDSQMKTNADNVATAIASASTATSDASSALSTANTASSNATEALSTANTANTTATTASTTASTALSTANSANTTATNAMNKANTVETNLSLLDSKVDSIIEKEKYSTTETLTNKVWINDKPIYRKVITSTSPSTNTWTLLDSGSYEFIVNINGELSGTENYAPISNYINFYILNGNLYWQAQDEFDQNKSCTFYIEYTKTSA